MFDRKKGSEIWVRNVQGWSVRMVTTTRKNRCRAGLGQNNILQSIIRLVGCMQRCPHKTTHQNAHAIVPPNCIMKFAMQTL
eukprot:6106201-Amphidinium_carterae.1